MSAAAEVLARLSAAGITLALDGDRLLAQPASSLTDPHRTLIRANKADLLRLLAERRRAWDVTEPTGAVWRSCVSPPMTMAELLAAYPAGTKAVPVEDPDEGHPLPPDIEAAVLGWLAQIGEDCPDIRREILDRARDVPEARADYLSRGRPATPRGPNHDGTDRSGTDPQEPKP